MEAMDYRLGKEKKKGARESAENADLLFLDVLCTYFETEQILTKEQIERFRKSGSGKTGWYRRENRTGGQTSRERRFSGRILKIWKRNRDR